MEKRIGEEEVMGKVPVQRENMKKDTTKYPEVPVSPTRSTAADPPCPLPKRRAQAPRTNKRIENRNNTKNQQQPRRATTETETNRQETIAAFAKAACPL